MPTINVTVDLHFRKHQLQMFQNRKRFDVRVVHRRFGKTFQSIAELLVDALQTNLEDWRGFYIAPTYTHAKSIAWDYLTQFCQPIPGTKINQQELRIDLPNGSRIKLLGAENYNSLRGLYADAMVLDETALIPSPAWSTVLSPMLSDRKGRATFTGTPMGRHNLFHELYEYALSGDDPEWQATLLTHKDTDVLDPEEIKRLHRMMREDEFEQEMNCSWSASMRGAFFGKEMTLAEAEGRVTTVKHDKSLPVVAAVDLGWSDAMVVTLWQKAGSEHRCLGALSYEQTSIPDMIAHWKSDWPYKVDRVILPHDAKVHELGTGKTRNQVFLSLGCATTICPSQSIHEGINAVRDILPNTWFDREDTKVLREALVGYRSGYDEVKRIHSMTPLHSWESHYADSVRYYALGRPHRTTQKDRPAMQLGLSA